LTALNIRAQLFITAIMAKKSNVNNEDLEKIVSFAKRKDLFFLLQTFMAD